MYTQLHIYIRQTEINTNRHTQTYTDILGQTDRTKVQEGRQTSILKDQCSHIHIYSTKDRNTDRQADTQTGKTDKKDKQTNRQTV